MYITCHEIEQKKKNIKQPPTTIRPSQLPRATPHRKGHDSVFNEMMEN